MMNFLKKDLLALAYGVAFTLISVVVPQGPDLGAAVAFSFFVSTGGWLTATALVDYVALRYRQGTKRQHQILLMLRIGAIIVAVLLAAIYFLGLRTKSSYSFPEIAFYLFLVFVFSVSVRTVAYSGGLAKKNAEQRARSRRNANSGDG